MVAQHVEVVNAIAEAVLEAADFGGRRDCQMEGTATLVRVADRLHAHLGDGLHHRFRVGQPRFVLDFEDHGFAHFFSIGSEPVPKGIEPPRRQGRQEKTKRRKRMDKGFHIFSPFSPAFFLFRSSLSSLGVLGVLAVQCLWEPTLSAGSSVSATPGSPARNSSPDRSGTHAGRRPGSFPVRGTAVHSGPGPTHGRLC